MRADWFQKSGLLVVALALGCSGGPVDHPRDPAQERLARIGRAYLAACKRLDRAPKDISELKPELKDEPDDVLRSPTDRSEFVITWGVDFRKLQPRPGDPFTVVAYEQTGADGERYVLRIPFSVVLMTNDEFAKASFPPGHRPNE
jgi:hypothetical protein